MDANPICSCSGMAGWIAKIEESITHSKLVLTLFTAAWSEPSKLMYSNILQIAKKYPEVIYCNVDVEESKDISANMAIRKVPSYLFINKGKEAERIKGIVSADVLEQKIVSYITPSKEA